MASIHETHHEGMSKALSTQPLTGLQTAENTGRSEKQRDLADAAHMIDIGPAAVQQVLSQLWDRAFEQGQLAALDELQDRFCVCMK